MPGVSAAASLSNALRTSRWNGVAARHSTRDREKYSAVSSASVKPVSSSRRNARCSSVQYFLPSWVSSKSGNPADCSASRSRLIVRVETPVRSARSSIVTRRDDSRSRRIDHCLMTSALRMCISRSGSSQSAR